MADRLLFDTTILVDHLHGNERARRYIKSVPDTKCISVITRAEIIESYLYIESEDIRQALQYAAWLTEEKHDLVLGAARPSRSPGKA